jgi:hypothetical protein
MEKKLTMEAGFATGFPKTYPGYYVVVMLGERPIEIFGSLPPHNLENKLPYKYYMGQYINQKHPAFVPGVLVVAIPRCLLS